MWHRRMIPDGWVDPEGEIPAIDKDDDSPLHVEGLVIEDPGRANSWKDVYGVLLDSHFLLLETKKRETGKTQSTHVIRVKCIRCDVPLLSLLSKVTSFSPSHWSVYDWVMPWAPRRVEKAMQACISPSVQAPNRPHNTYIPSPYIMPIPRKLTPYTPIFRRGGMGGSIISLARFKHERTKLGSRYSSFPFSIF
ncbi:hypothetical protein BC827DRAFT_1301641 [Russula dissimulans]|nr:hypothetical protein BC827DRAFT_1301641 [Russula dissimulans]